MKAWGGGGEKEGFYDFFRMFEDKGFCGTKFASIKRIFEEICIERNDISFRFLRTKEK